VKLGVDTYSLRWQGWDAFELVDYGKRIGLDIVHFSDVAPFKSLDDEYLKRLKTHADEQNIDLEVGMGSICPTSTTFRSDRGSAVEQVQQRLHIAHILGSKTVRCFLGANADRRTALPLNEHIKAAVATCKAVRSQALDLGIKLAIENHSGDLQGRELKLLIEDAGPDCAGACIDTGNPFYVIESPFVTLQHLAPYVVTSHVRDVAIWEHPRGAAIQWLVMGDGTFGIQEWTRLFKEQCPTSSYTLEIIAGRTPRVLNYLEPSFWEAYRETPAAEFAQFVKLAKDGYPFMGPMLAAVSDAVPQPYQASFTLQQRLDLERSVRYCHEVLGIGMRS
jgi:3-oxoisoapionate decarboxylase